MCSPTSVMSDRFFVSMIATIFSLAAINEEPRTRTQTHET
jgi:hypothetical protein